MNVMIDDPVPVDRVTVTLKELLQIERCPRAWRALDLYLVRDGPVVFYVGQSYVAFDRVWSHFYGGFKARSLLGRLILCNWPASMHWTVELLSSRLERFAAVEHRLDAAERVLIQDLAPCLNEALNRQPTPLPEVYRPPTATPTCPRSPNKLIHEAAYALKAEQRRAWLESGG
jgi:hypothetical protein